MRIFLIVILITLLYGCNNGNSLNAESDQATYFSDSSSSLKSNDDSNTNGVGIYVADEGAKYSGFTVNYYSDKNCETSFNHYDYVIPKGPLTIKTPTNIFVSLTYIAENYTSGSFDGLYRDSFVNHYIKSIRVKYNFDHLQPLYSQCIFDSNQDFEGILNFSDFIENGSNNINLIKPCDTKDFRKCTLSNSYNYPPAKNTPLYTISTWVQKTLVAYEKNIVGSDANLQKGVGINANERFIPDGNTGCIIDKLTGLEWPGDWTSIYTRNVNLEGAKAQVIADNNNSGMCGYKDWKLPTVNELMSLKSYYTVFNGDYRDPKAMSWLNSYGFHGVQDIIERVSGGKDVYSAYWTSDQYAGDSSQEWLVTEDDPTTDYVFGYNFPKFAPKINSGELSNYWNPPCMYYCPPPTNPYTIIKNYAVPVRQYINDNSFIARPIATTGSESQGVPWSSDSRFSIINNGCNIKDNVTGLVWLRDSSFIKTDWRNGLTLIANMNINKKCGLENWRMPNANELMSLINYASSNNSEWLNTVGFKNISPDNYMTSTLNSDLEPIYQGLEFYIAINFGDIDHNNLIEPYSISDPTSYDQETLGYLLPVSGPN